MRFVQFILISGFMILMTKVQAAEMRREKSAPSIKAMTTSGPIRSQRRLGITFYGSASYGTNLVEYNITSQIAVGVGVGTEEGYFLNKIDKLKISSKYYIFKTSLSPYLEAGYVLKDKIARRNSDNFLYGGAGAQYMLKNGLSLSLALAYFRFEERDRLKPGITIHWFF